jgi:hypothetical protein
MVVGPKCVGDPVVGTHTCVPVHWIGAHGSAGKGVEGAHYGRACWLNRRTHVCTYRVNRCA